MAAYRAVGAEGVRSQQVGPCRVLHVSQVDAIGAVAHLGQAPVPGAINQCREQVVVAGAEDEMGRNETVHRSLHWRR